MLNVTPRKQILDERQVAYLETTWNSVSQIYIFSDFLSEFLRQSAHTIRKYIGLSSRVTSSDHIPRFVVFVSFQNHCTLLKSYNAL